MTRIVVVDDHHIVREGLRALLATEPDFQLVDEASDGLEAIRLVERLEPDVLILDVMIPGLNGLDVTRRVSKSSPKTRVIILSMHSNEAYVIEALKNGAAAYVLKGATATELVLAIREVAAGRRFLSSPLSERAIETYVARAQESDPLEAYDTLTTREREVLQLVAEGNSNQQAAARLFISPRTVETHRANLMNKLSLRNHADLVRFAFERGILAHR